MATLEISTQPFQFDAQLRDGERGERILDRRFARWYEIQPVADFLQRAGIDRLWKCRDTGREFWVEYKTDRRAAETGRIFVETVSVTTAGKLGWAYTSKAQLLVTYIPDQKVALVTQMTTIKRLLPEWLREYPQAPARNEGYETIGLLVPIEDFRHQSDAHTIYVGDEL